MSEATREATREAREGVTAATRRHPMRRRGGAGALAMAAAIAMAANAGCGGATQKGQDGAGGPAAAQPAAGAEAAPPAPSGPSYGAVPLIPREVLFGNPVKTSPALSPDGKRLAYLAPDQGVLNVFVKTIGKDDDKVVTADKLRGIRQYFWAENGKQIIYLQDKGGDENWHVYAVPAAGGEARDLTPLEKVQAQIVAVERKAPDHILVALNDRNPQLHDVYKVDLRSGERKLEVQNDIGAVGWLADHRLRVRGAQVLTPDGGAKLMVRPGATGAWKELAHWAAEDMFTTGPAGFTGDDRGVYMLTSVGSNTTELRRLDARTGAEKALASDPEADVTGVVTDPVSHDIVAVAFGRDRLQWKALDDKVAGDIEAMTRLGDGDASVVSTDQRNRTWLVLIDDDNGPPRFFSYDRKSKQGTFLFTSRPELEKLELAEMKPVSYQARDGLTIHAYLTLPAKVPAKGLPVVIYPHGGPWARDSWGFEPTAQWLANRGYAVLQPNFRGSTGYGKKFLNAADREWGGKMQDDVTDGTRWLVDQGVGDPKRICIMGGSYGGYATLMGLAKEPSIYACGVDICGVANLVTWINTIPPYWMPFLHVLHQRVGDPEKDAAFLKSRSPVFLTDRMRTPLLIGQGTNDPRVPRNESIQIRDAMKKAGKHVEYIEFADEGHGFARPENRLKFFGMAEAFLARYIGGRVEK
ncbi:MAG TPA: S9 family peptidase [Kofleriaceae bacterium]|nr:S9 family peptidase [Kofleriaceae bacterium]